MNLQGETYMQELADGAEPQDLLESADKEVASLRARVERLETAIRKALPFGMSEEADNLLNEALTSSSSTFGAVWRALVKSVEELSSAGVDFSDERMSYEVVQVTRGAKDRAQAALAAAKSVMEEKS